MAMSPRSKAAITFTIFFLPSVFSSNLTMGLIFDNTAISVQSKDIMKLENMLYKNYFTSKKGWFWFLLHLSISSKLDVLLKNVIL